MVGNCTQFANALLGYLSAAFAPGSSRYRCAFSRPPLSHADEWNRAADQGAHLKEAVHVRFRGSLTAREQQGTFDLLRHGLLSEFSLSERSHRVRGEDARLSAGRERVRRGLAGRPLVPVACTAPL